MHWGTPTSRLASIEAVAAGVDYPDGGQPPPEYANITEGLVRASPLTVLGPRLTEPPLSAYELLIKHMSSEDVRAAIGGI